MEIYTFPEPGHWAVPLHQHAAEGNKKKHLHHMMDEQTGDFCGQIWVGMASQQLPKLCCTPETLCSWKFLSYLY